MAIDFLRTADFLWEELQAFYTVLRRGGDERELQTVVERLRSAVDHVEPLAEDPGEGWNELPKGQRWGYLRLLSHLGTATHELKRVGWSRG
jgi:hypothetical protein